MRTYSDTLIEEYNNHTHRDDDTMHSPAHEIHAKGIPSLVIALLTIASAIIFTAPSPSLSNDSPASRTVTVFFFWGIGCPHCEKAKPFLEYLSRSYPDVEIRSFEVVANKNNLELLEKMASARGAVVSGVPVCIIGGKVFSGYDETVRQEIESAVKTALSLKKTEGGASPPVAAESITLPFFGKTDPQSLSLPVFTLVIAALDSFNPCAFFVLFTLLSLLVHAHSRKRMLLIGGVFVSASGLLYFLFMAAWMNLYFLVGHLAAVTYGAGITALLISLINIKDYFFFNKWISLSIPEAAKPKLFERMRGLLRSDSLPAALAGSAVLAVAANSYELLCTAGFPMVYTRVLTLKSLSTAGYYAYLTLYNLIYIIPLSIVVILFVASMGSRKLTERQGRVMKLVSGLMMFGLAVVLLVKPELLQNATASALLLGAVIGLTVLIVLATKGMLPGTRTH